MELPSTGDVAFEGKLRSVLEETAAGSSELLGQLLEAYRPYLLKVANEELDSDLRGKAGPSDLVQQTFLDANRDIVQFRGKSEAELLAWLRRVLLNNLANFRREFRDTDKRDVGREIAVDPGALQNSALAAHDPSPSGEAQAREETEALERALARLPDDYREALVLRHQKGRSFAEIGAALGRSADAARKLWARAVEALQSELKRTE